MPYLVDGNNLAHALGLSNEGLADRESCAQAVATFCRVQGAKATLVFDGPASQGRKAAHLTNLVRIRFSEARSADDVILRLLVDSRTPRDFTVVTSDKSLGDRARHKGATVEKAHEFARRMGRPAKAAGPSSGKPSRKETPAQIDAWLAVFDPGRK